MVPNYVRVKPVEGGAFWAVKSEVSEFSLYTHCGLNGETHYPPNVLVAAAGDIAWEHPARMNTKYAELELIDE